MSRRIEPYSDSAAARAELIPFLAQQFSEGVNEGLWRARLVHWWDENPQAQDCPHRGWILRHDGVLVGFLGLIPTLYVQHGKPVPALIATSWVVMDGHRQAALPMGLKLHRLARTHLLVDTTPSLEVQNILLRLGWVGETQVRRVVLPLGYAGQLFAKFKGWVWPRLGAGRRFVLDVNEVRRIPRPWQQAERVEKWISLESLRWYAAAPARHHQFVGVVDEQGSLTSYLWLTPRSRCGIRLWVLLESFTMGPDDMELRSIVGALTRRELVLPGPRALLLSLQAFPQDTHWREVFGPIDDQAFVCHFHVLPPEIRAVPKHTVVAEGDFGL